MIYEFECSICKKITERQFKVKECPKIIFCEFCGSRAKKIMSVPAKPGIIFYNAPVKIDKNNKQE